MRISAFIKKCTSGPHGCKEILSNISHARKTLKLGVRKVEHNKRQFIKSFWFTPLCDSVSVSNDIRTCHFG